MIISTFFLLCVCVTHVCFLCLGVGGVCQFVSVLFLIEKSISRAVVTRGKCVVLKIPVVSIKKTSEYVL